MPNPLNHKQKAYALAFSTGETKGNKTKSAIAAGYSPRTAADAGCRLSTNPKILELIAKHETAVVEKAEVKGADILKGLSNLAHSDVLDLFNEDGTLKHPSQMSPQIRLAVKKLKFTELFEGASGEKFCVGRMVEIELWSKETGLVKLGENVGLFKTKDEKRIEESLADMLAEARGPADDE